MIDNLFPIEKPKKILVVDKDQVVLNLMINQLKTMEYNSFDAFSDGAEAWHALQFGNYDLVIMEWGLTNLSGFVIFNRLRRHGNYHSVPVLIVSHGIIKEDFRLLQEFPCTDFLEKPFTKVSFEKKLGELLKDTQWHRNNVDSINKILDASQKDGKKAISLLKDFMKNAPNPIPVAIIAGRQLLKNEFYREAENLFRLVTQKDPHSILALGELGKALHLQQRHQEAYDILSMVQKISPKNLERLCLMGEVKLNDLDPGIARKHFTKVLELDSDDDKAKAGLVVAGNLEEHMITNNNKDAVTYNFASIANAVGISLVRRGRCMEGIKQYLSAANFVYKDMEKTKIDFNIGLGYLRWKKPEEALNWFKKSHDSAKDKSFKKALKYMQKIEKLLKDNSDAKSKDAEKVIQAKEQQLNKIIEQSKNAEEGTEVADKLGLTKPEETKSEEVKKAS